MAEALAGVHEQEHAVDHRERAFDFAAEVGVPRGVDDVDGEVAVGDGGVLGEDRDAFFPLQVGRVHDPVGYLFVGAKSPGLAEHGVHQGRLAVVNVGNDGHVPYVSAMHCAHLCGVGAAGGSPPRSPFRVPGHGGQPVSRLGRPEVLSGRPGRRGAS